MIESRRAVLVVEGTVADVVIVETGSGQPSFGPDRFEERAVYLDVFLRRLCNTDLEQAGVGGRPAVLRLRCGDLDADCLALEPGASVRAHAWYPAYERHSLGQVVTGPPELVELELFEKASVQVIPSNERRK